MGDALRRDHGSDRGVTLVEMLVAVLVFGVLSAVIGSTVLNSLVTTRRTQDRLYQVADVHNTFDRISREVRVADPILSADATMLSVRVFRGGFCWTHTWTYAAGAGTLSHTTTQYDAVDTFTCGTTLLSGPSTRTLLRNVAATSEPVFRYYRADTATTTTTTAPSPLAVPVSDVGQVRRVVLTVGAGLTEGRPPVVVETSVELRNAR